ncbi:cytochrome c2 [Cognatishimia sp. WU-CL00825]|uniref:c-type cytochrome n=1 Tax=Cognatishimia sp. WU-CL00825 TaxID=3127658 RepID=UPI0031076497
MNVGKYFGVLAVVPFFAGAALAGDAALGEKNFKRCKSCHAITADDGTKIMKGGKTGPNLFGVIGRTVGSEEGFNYSASMQAAAAAGLVWDEENLAAFVLDPKGWLKEVLSDPSAKSKMTLKLKKGGDDVAAFLASAGSS